MRTSVLRASSALAVLVAGCGAGDDLDRGSCAWEGSIIVCERSDEGRPDIIDDEQEITVELTVERSALDARSHTISGIADLVSSAYYPVPPIDETRGVGFDPNPSRDPVITDVLVLVRRHGASSIPTAYERVEVQGSITLDESARGRVVVFGIDATVAP